MLRGAYSEDPPLFSSEIQPAYGQGMNQVIGPWFELMHKYLGDQWSAGDRPGLKRAMATDLPPARAWGLAAMGDFPGGDEPPQTFEEYDPEWARAPRAHWGVLGAAGSALTRGRRWSRSGRTS
ncbi:hypothetical protein P3T27_001999 [Kitasatospora sp. MAA19]|uniref:hypothetical protein n=1 Tax=Kitasatospora sp. MAA19 TaxID=3035090 RepID=UPI002475585B|nr:hypothetical protein [Kitasatospora sp. MAA19]MDH6705291.1 hypothetical protein [Kitasatospora sp. MAA19]